MDAEGTAGGSSTKPAEGGSAPNAAQEQFNTGYGKGTEKGKREGREEILRELGVTSPEEAKALAKAARDADAATKKAAEEQGQFKGLYESEKKARETDAATLADLRKQVESFQSAQKAELDTLNAKLSADQKKLLDGLPLDRQVALARAFAAATPGGVGAPAGKGTTPGGGDAKTKLEAYAKKGVANLTKEERADMHVLLAEVGS